MLCKLIKDDLKTALKYKEMDTANAIRVILGEFSRLNKLAVELPTDDEVFKILKGLKKNEELVLEKQGKEYSVFFNVVTAYLPKTMTKSEIKEYVETSDIELEGHLGQSMSQLMKELKGKADGKLVKEVLIELIKEN